jgi:hypothetical protein
MASEGNRMGGQDRQNYQLVHPDVHPVLPVRAFLLMASAGEVHA